MAGAGAVPGPVPGAGELLRRARRVLRTRWDLLLVIAAGGVVGSLGRWAVSLALPHTGREFPWSTFLVNVLGCLVIGALMWAVTELWPPSRYRSPFLRTGVLGGFTTFSAFGLDAHTLAGAGAASVAVVYVVASVVAGVLAVPLGAAAAAGTHRSLQGVRRPHQEEQ